VLPCRPFVLSRRNDISLLFVRHAEVTRHSNTKYAAFHPHEFNTVNARIIFSLSLFSLCDFSLNRLGSLYGGTQGNCCEDFYRSDALSLPVNNVKARNSNIIIMIISLMIINVVSVITLICMKMKIAPVRSSLLSIHQ